jgi:ribosomal protein S18 acetylase RimI-like enzyme
MAQIVQVVPLAGKEHVALVRELFLEYAGYLRQRHGEVCMGSYEKEVAELPGDYAPPSGCLLLAFANAQAAGCVGLRKIKDGTCEMKRLYVRPAFRGQQLGHRLATAVIDEARRLGYARIRLDTLPVMHEAIGLYQSLGFAGIESYSGHHPEGAVCMELVLQG